MSETQTKIEIQNDKKPVEPNLSTPCRTNATSVSARVPKNETQIDGNGGENVNAVVTKAKTAAIFLWTLLHAQVCPCKANSCPHKGCEDSKRLLLHIHNCSAKSPDVACPMSCPGCQQARKLLIHYRKCREIRIRQRKRNGPQSNSQQTNFCLICTLLSRHDKGISEKSTCLRVTSPLPSTPQKPGRRKVRSKSVQFDLNRERKSFHSPGGMPPPPPRSALTRVVPLDTFSINVKGGNRPRGGSLDERRLNSDIRGHDPTVEMDLRANRSDETIELRPLERQLPFRKRSVSCSLIPDEKSTGCDTIMEE